MAKTDKKERILEAAAALFMTKGLSATKMIDIAEAAGIGKGTIYEYFRSKEELFEQLFDKMIFEMYRGMDDILTRDCSAEEKLAAYVGFDSGLTQKVRITRDVIYNIIVDTTGNRPSPAHQCVKRLMEYRFSILSQIISEGMENGEFAKADPLMVSASIMGALAFYLCFNYDFLEDEAPDRFHGKKPWKDEEFIRLLVGGLRQGTIPEIC